MVLEFTGICIPTNISLMVVASCLGVGIGASIIENEKEKELNEEGGGETGEGMSEKQEE